MIILCVELQRFHRWRPCKNNSKSVLKFKFHHHNCSILIVMNCLMYVCVCMCMCAYICICLRDSRCVCGTTKLPPKTPRHLANSQLWEQKKRVRAMQTIFGGGIQAAYNTQQVKEAELIFGGRSFFGQPQSDACSGASHCCTHCVPQSLGYVSLSVWCGGCSMSIYVGCRQPAAS